MTYLKPQWSTPSNVHALSTTRLKGCSSAPYDHNNLALHVGDLESHALANRAALRAELGFSQEPQWLNQTHSTDCIVIEKESHRNADAAITRQKNTPLAIMTADCLPIVLCNQAGTEIAAIHAGWRGLAYGILENTLSRMQTPAQQILAWIGPSICHSCYGIGEEVQSTFTERYPFTQSTFHYLGSQCYANLSRMAELILNAQGVMDVHQSGACTFEENDRFYSYRRASQTGRIATLIWLG